MDNRKRNSNRSAREQAALKRKKVLCGVLGVVMLIVLAIQFGSSDEEPELALQTPQINPAVVAAVTPGKLQPDPALAAINESFEIVDLPSKPMDEIVLDNPFGIEPALNSQTSAISSDAPAMEVRAVYSSSRRGSALVGQSIVHQGESLPSGDRLMTVSPSGIQIKKKD